MRPTILIWLIAVVACNSNEQKKPQTTKDTVKTITDTNAIEPQVKPDTLLKTYSNKRFRNVTVKKTGEHEFLVRGQGQVFEAAFSWVVEDGHEELKKGFQMTDAGAPEWGKFEFAINVAKRRDNSTLTLILFEASANDGSRQFELPIPLY